MFFYDAFSFIQVTFLLLILLGLGAAAAVAGESEWPTVEDQAASRTPPDLPSA
jgi:hypothetical protein